MSLKFVGRLIAVVSLALLVSGCGNKEKEELTVLIKMMPAQQRYFEDKVLPAFEKKFNCKVNVATFNNAAEITRKLELDAKKATPEISLVKTPFEMTTVLVDKGLVQPLAAVTNADQVNMDIAPYHPVAASMGMVNDTFYYFPRKLETRILFYLKSKVADAVNRFDSYREGVNGILKEQNGYGLPAGYVLENDPSVWDFYDLFVVGYIWSQEEYNGKKAGRIAHRGAKYEGTALFMVDRAYQFGDSKENILRMDGDGVKNTYLWEKVFVENGLYSTGMWQDPWYGADIWNGVKDGKVFMAYFQQIDFFNVHGWAEDPGMPSYMEDPEDMGMAIIPQAVSFELNDEGFPKSVGGRNITTGGWWWGIPKAAPNAKLAYEFSKFITSRDQNAREVAQFGMIPVRKDLLNNFANVFNEGWVGEIFKTSVDQISMHLVDSSMIVVPQNKNYSALAENYIDAWNDLINTAGDKKPLTTKSMEEFLATGYSEKTKIILGESYPTPQE